MKFLQLLINLLPSQPNLEEAAALAQRTAREAEASTALASQTADQSVERAKEEYQRRLDTAARTAEAQIARAVEARNNRTSQVIATLEDAWNRLATAKRVSEQQERDAEIQRQKSLAAVEEGFRTKQLELETYLASLQEKLAGLSDEQSDQRKALETRHQNERLAAQAEIQGGEEAAGKLRSVLQGLY